MLKFVLFFIYFFLISILTSPLIWGQIDNDGCNKIRDAIKKKCMPFLDEYRTNLYECDTITDPKDRCSCYVEKTAKLGCFSSKEKVKIIEYIRGGKVVDVLNNIKPNIKPNEPEPEPQPQPEPQPEPTPSICDKCINIFARITELEELRQKIEELSKKLKSLTEDLKKFNKDLTDLSSSFKNFTTKLESLKVNFEELKEKINKINNKLKEIEDDLKNTIKDIKNIKEYITEIIKNIDDISNELYKLKIRFDNLVSNLPQVFYCPGCYPFWGFSFKVGSFFIPKSTSFKNMIENNFTLGFDWIWRFNRFFGIIGGYNFINFNINYFEINSNYVNSDNWQNKIFNFGLRFEIPIPSTVISFNPSLSAFYGTKIKRNPNNPNNLYKIWKGYKASLELTLNEFHLKNNFEFYLSVEYFHFPKPEYQYFQIDQNRIINDFGMHALIFSAGFRLNLWNNVFTYFGGGSKVSI